ncbi:alpha/beta hydrolase family esterase [Halioglobus maricola]|nr:PHB depolymerase family esterase [Halioglobus maricola]
MKLFFKYLALALVLVIVGLALTASWYLRWDEIEPPQLPGQVQGGSLEHEGLERNWLAYVPDAAGENPPLVLVLHGSMSDGTVARSGTFYSFDVLAAREGFVVAYPDGIEQHWNDCRMHANYAANQRNIDDVGFLRKLVADLAERHGIDQTRVYVTGISNGGHMAYRMAMEAPELIAGAAPVVANMPVPDNLDCEQRGEAVPMYILNGTDDGINPYGGGTVELFGDASRALVLSAEASATYWAELAGYSGAGVREALPQSNPDDDTSLERLVWNEADKAPVELMTVRGGGHQFLHPVYSGPRILGTTSHQADGAELIWAFFSSI